MPSRPPLVLGADGLIQQLQAGDDLNAGGWAAFTPAVTIGSGSATASAAGRYRKSGTTIFLEIAVALSSPSLGANGLTITLPFQASAFRWSIPGEFVGGSMVRGSIVASAGTMTITTYSAGSAVAAGTIVLCGFYEAASA